MASRVAELAGSIEKIGFDYVAVPDHVAATRVGAVKMRSSAIFPAWADRWPMLDQATTLTAAAQGTTRIRLWTSILIAPLRHPLIAAHQLATLDQLSGGRVTAGVGSGWDDREFAALGIDYGSRGAITTEAIEIYDLAWRNEWASFDGEFFAFEDVSILPTPMQKPRIPIFYGGDSLVAARRAARQCDGLYPRIDENAASPASLHNPLRDAIKYEADRIGRDLTGFELAIIGSCELNAPPSVATPWLSGSASAILERLAELAGEGIGYCTLRPILHGETFEDFVESAQALAEDVLPHAGWISAAPL